MAQHEHEPTFLYKFVFEDVLVNMEYMCEREHCDYYRVVQWEVQFDTMKEDGEPLDEDSAFEVWGDICNEYGEFFIDYEQHRPEGNIYRDESGLEIVYDRSKSQALFVLEYNGKTIEFNAKHYRVLD